VLLLVLVFFGVSGRDASDERGGGPEGYEGVRDIRAVRVIAVIMIVRVI